MSLLRLNLFPAGIAGIEIVPVFDVVLVFLPAEKNFAVAVLAWQFEQRGNEIEFLCYDPNMGAQTTVIHYDTVTRAFSLPANHYFPGGKLNVYEVYRNALF